MNDQKKYKEDILRKYINPERLEKAPEGFTSKLMTRIQIETEPLKAKERLLSKNIVPLISSIIALILIITTYIVPTGSKDPFLQPGLKLIQNIDLPAFRINFDSLFSLNLPAWTTYSFVAIFILTVFDRALYEFFHRE